MFDKPGAVNYDTFKSSAVDDYMSEAYPLPDIAVEMWPYPSRERAERLSRISHGLDDGRFDWS